MKHVDPRARTLTALGYLVGLVCLVPVSLLTFTQPTVDGAACGTFLFPEFSARGLGDAEKRLRAAGGTSTDAARLHHRASACNDALHERRMWTLATVGLGFMVGVAVPVAGRARLTARRLAPSTREQPSELVEDDPRPTPYHRPTLRSAVSRRPGSALRASR